MKPKINVLRAVTAAVGQRAVRLAALISGGAFAVIFAAIWALAYFFSDWWWLLLIVYVPLLLIGLGAWAIARFIVKRLYPRRVTSEQKVLLNSFTDKIQRLLETRGMGWPVFALLNVKDLVLHRDLRTTKELLEDTTSLKRDFAELEEKLQS